MEQRPSHLQGKEHSLATQDKETGIENGQIRKSLKKKIHGYIHVLYGYDDDTHLNRGPCRGCAGPFRRAVDLQLKREEQRGSDDRCCGCRRLLRWCCCCCSCGGGTQTRLTPKAVGTVGDGRGAGVLVACSNLDVGLGVVGEGGSGLSHSCRCQK